MSLKRTWSILRKDVRLGPRSPILLWALVIPILLTVLVRGVFGGLLDRQPALAIVDFATSQITASLAAIDDVSVTQLDGIDELQARIADGTYDVGLILDDGFDAALAARTFPTLTLLVSAQATPIDQAVAVVTIIDAIRDVAGDRPPIDVVVIDPAAPTLPWELRLLPLLVIYAVAIPGGMIPASSLVEEKERGTILPILTTPTTVFDICAAKAILGVIMAVLAGTVTLILNDAFGGQAAALVTAIVIGSVMMAMIGLMFGALAPDTNTLFAAWKGGGIVIFLPVIFFIWPDLPMWPGQLMPAWYFLYPTFAVAVEGATLADVVAELAIGAAICVALLPAVIATARRMERRLVAGAAPADATELVESML